MLLSQSSARPELASRALVNAYMICAYCKEEIADGAAKCRWCHENLVARVGLSSSGSPGYTKLQFTSDLAKALAWPLIIAVLLLLIKDDLSQLMKRIRTLEVAGTKSEFVDYAAAFGYLQERVTALANEPHAAGREELRDEIQRTTRELKGLHPIALGFLVEFGRGVVQDDSWGDKRYQSYLFDLYQRDLVELDPTPRTADDITTKTKGKLSDTGANLLKRIGFQDPQRH